MDTWRPKTEAVFFLKGTCEIFTIVIKSQPYSNSYLKVKSAMSLNTGLLVVKENFFVTWNAKKV